MKKESILTYFIILFSISLLISCSVNKNKEKDAFADSEDIFFDSGNENQESSAKSDDDFFASTEEKKEDAVEEVKEVAEAVPEEKIEKTIEMKKEIIPPPVVMKEEMPKRNIAGLGSYKVKKNETLMWIAFKIYGDYRMWKKLSKLNNNVIDVHEGMVLNYSSDGRNFKWDPKGLPYLIKKGETLSKISNKVYGIPSKWKKIYENNREMIRNPNLIFAGFTLYYIKNTNQLALF